MIKYLWLIIKNQSERLIALAIPTLPTAPILVPLELKILGVGYLGLASLRILYILILLLGACLWEKMRKPVHFWLKGNSEHHVREWIADGLATYLYKISIFWVCMVLMWAFSHPISLKKIAGLSFIYLIENLIIGRISGIILDWFHRRFPSLPKTKKP